MKLIGSTTSPYVRRVRLLLEGQDYEFELVKALGPDGPKTLAAYTPIKKIPILLIDQMCLFDSSIICEYLLEKKSIHLSISEKLNLKLIDELCDACISLFQQKFWATDLHWESEPSKRMLERARDILDFLEVKMTTKTLGTIEQDWLFCVLDWVNFRNVLAWKPGHGALVDFYQESSPLKKYQSTQIIA